VFALFDLVAQGAALAPEDAWVVDVGCGFGTNAVHCAQKFGPARITGVNVSRVQLATARSRAAQAGVEHRVDFVEASATALPMPDGAVDKVISVEAAFHFDTRERFLAESFRVLRPGGRLSLVDLVIPAPSRAWHRPALEAVRRSQAVPLANVYDRATYLDHVRAAGFEIVEEESIHSRVFASFRRWQLTRSPALIFGYDWMFITASLPYFLYPFDYLRLVARKPA
jgi:ubiquinone/menaquinone biosynthesis C-methylase UbiE